MVDQTRLGQWDRTIRNCQVADIPAGSTPKYISVRLPGESGDLIDAWWSGSPALAVNDYVKLLRQVDVPQYEIIGTSGATPSTPAVHGHSADVVTVDTAGFAGNLSAADDTVQKALDTLDDMAGGGGGWPFAKNLTVSPTDPDADYSTIAAAITAASAGDLILLDSGTYAETITVNKAITISGLDPDNTIITTATNDAVPVTISATVTLQNLTVSQTATGGTNAYAVELVSGGLLYARGCIFKKTGGTPTNSTGVKINSAATHNSKLTDCTVQVLAGTNAYGVYASKHCEVIGGRYQATDAAIKADNSAFVDLAELPRLLSPATDDTGGAGTITGLYLDSNGNILSVGGAGARTVIAGDIHASTSKTTPVDADELGLVDSAASNALKKLTWANLKATLQTWLGTLRDATKVSKLVASDGSPDPAWSTDAAGQLSGVANLDILPFADGSGLFTRNVNHWFVPTDHFNSFSGWTWASYGIWDGAPAVVDTTTFPSLLRLRNNDTSEDHFAYKAVSGSTSQIICKLAVGIDSYVGIRIDDGTDNNFFEVRLITSPTVGGMMAIQERLRTGGGSISTNTRQNPLPPGFYVLKILRDTSGTWGVYGFMTKDTPAPFYNGGGASGLTWTPANGGIIFGQRTVADNDDRIGLFDWYQVI